jgi:hypothetical protein
MQSDQTLAITQPRSNVETPGLFADREATGYNRVTRMAESLVLYLFSPKHLLT